MSNVETYLSYLAGTYEGELPEPRPIRQELYLAALCEIYTGDLPAPVTHADFLLRELAKKGVGEDFEITDARYLFTSGARFDVMDVLFEHIPYIKNAASMFQYCAPSMCGVDDLFSVLPEDFIEKLKPTEITQSMFANAGSLKSFPDISFDSAVTISSMFSGASSLETVGNISMPAAPPNNGLQYMFQSCSKLKTVGDITVGNNESVGCASMFNGCSNLENIGALNFKPNYAYQMFYGCSSLKEVPKMDLSECTYISNMFQGCTGLNGTVNIGKHNSTRNISNTFGGCKNIKAIEDFYVSSTSYVAGGTTFPVGSATDIVALKRLTIHPEATYTGFTFNLSFCSFERSGMVEFFNSLLDITDSTASSSYKTITITGNPCVLDGYSLSKNTAYSTYKTHEALIEYAIKRYRGFDCQGAPIKYYLSGGSSNSAVEGVFSDITTDMFDAGNVYVQFLADTISVPEDQRLSDSDKQIAIDKGWTLKI